MTTIENDILSVSINSKGAELDSIYHKGNQIEYLWSGDPAFWAKKSPILFPIVGTLKENTYYFENKAYGLGRHGFARDMEFKVVNESACTIHFLLVSDRETVKKFPFSFEFSIIYTVAKNYLTVTYIMKNISNKEMYFSVGGHPAFKVPLVESTTYDDYYLEFNSIENAPRWPISKEGLIEPVPVSFLNNTRRLPLRKELFSEDALVFKGLSSHSVSLKSDKTVHGLEFDFTGFPFLGIWAAKNADFVCIEPWCGIADPVETNQQLAEKEGINKLRGGDIFEKTWKVGLF